MKVGILTFHRAKNFGAVLQCYALQQFLHSLGHDVRVIDYAPSYLAGCGTQEKAWFRTFVKLLRNVIYKIINLGETSVHDGFDDFIKKRLNLIAYSQRHEVDCYVCGSDQIWSPIICNGLDSNYFAEFAMPPKQRISYAASMGRLPLDQKWETILSERLAKMDYVSVREQTAKVYLNTLGFYNVDVVLDPTLIAGEKVFNDITSPICQKRPFVLVYEIEHMDKTYCTARLLAKQLSADVVVIGGGLKKYFTKGLKNKQNLSPEQFVSYFKNASCIVTTSFHGTAFSIIFKKPFYFVKMNSYKDDRIISLLNKLNLEARIIGNNPKITFEEVDYSVCQKGISTEIELSKGFISNALCIK